MKALIRSRRKELAALSVYFILYMLSFTLLEKVTQPEYVIHCALDDLIPFCRWALIPYAAWFLWVPAIVLWTLWKEPEVFRRLFTVMALGSALALTVYALFPNGVNLRQTVTGNDLLSLGVRLLYRIDTSTNVCPSLHVYMSLCALTATLYSPTLRRFRTANILLAVSICASTVLLDQHSVIDVACACVLFLVVDAAVELPTRTQTQLARRTT